MKAGPFLYALAFCVVLPIILALWAVALDRALPDLPRYHWPLIGALAAAAGLALMILGMLALRRYGGGLPMNAYPPPRFVSRGVYALLPHPIYVGFIATCAGVAMIAGSGAGLWIVTPVTALGCAALVLGYERHDLNRRFGPNRPRPLLSLPRATDDPPTLWDRLSVAALVYLPWLLAYGALGHATPSTGVSAYLPFEHNWPVIEWTEWIYASIYPIAALALLLARCSADLRRFSIAGWIGTAVGHLLFFVVPLIADPRPFEPTSLAGQLLALERAEGTGGRAAFPSFHVFWAVLIATLIHRSRPRLALAAWAWALAVCISTITTGMHALVDLPAGALLAAAAWHATALWRSALALTERTANSWRDWRLGPVRIINYSAYAALGAFIGAGGAATLLGPHAAVPIAIVGLSALIGAGLWGQALVGSPTLLRPFGYYGCVIGAAAGLAAATFIGADPWRLAAAFATAAPWVQAAGRLRCLVQGCCHGAPTNAALGILYTRPLSRVCRIAQLSGTPIHPTPLYSIVSNAVIGLVLARLWSLGVPASCSVGLYLILAGLARFVEESYRGEPQTPIVAGLRLYQWFAAASVGLGIAVSAAPSPSVPATWIPNWPALAVGLALAAIYGAAMGADLPESNRRFSRLA